MVEVDDADKNGGECDDGREEDHRRHSEITEEITDPCKSCENDRNLPCLSHLEVYGMIPEIREGIDVRDAEERAEQDFSDMMVQVPRKRPEEILTPDYGNQDCCAESRLPVRQFPDQDEHDWDHNCRHKRWNPQGNGNDLVPGCGAGYHDNGGRDPGEQRAPRDVLPEWIQGHRLKPGVRGIIRHHLLNLAEAVHRVVGCNDVEDICIQCEKGEYPDPEGEYCE